MATMTSLPKRDIWLIPLISFLTILLLFAAAEVGSRVFFAEQMADSCKVPDPDPDIGAHERPNCTSMLKAAEGPWATTHFNALGRRSDPNWAPYPAGAKRVALVGTSVAQGYLLRYEDTTGATIARGLSSACHEPVETSIVGTNGFFANRVIRSVRNAMELKPSVVLLMFVSHDLLTLTDGAPANAALLDAPPSDEDPSLVRRVTNAISGSRAVTVAKHFLIRNPDIYIPLYLKIGDVSDFLRVPLTMLWQKRLTAFDTLLGQLAEITHAQDVPFAIVYAPQEAQSVLADRHTIPPGVDPFAFGAAIGALAAKHGIIYHDATTDFHVLANPQDAYYAVDGHISGEGQVVIGNNLVHTFLKTVPAFSKCAAPTVAAANSAQ